MEVHKPKLVHGWREFLVEIGVIVIGVLVALGAEQTAETLHWAHKVELGGDAINSEIRRNGAYYAFRVAAAPCVVRRLDELSRITESVAAHEKVAPVRLAGLHIGNLITDNAWQAERAEQTLTHLPREQLDGLSVLYAQQDDIKHWVMVEEDVWATLRMLEGDPNRLGSADMALLRNALQQARNLEFLIALNAKVQIAQSEKLGARVPAAAPAEMQSTCAPLDRSLNPDPMGTP